MKLSISIISCLWILFSSVAYAGSVQKQLLIASKGQTAIAADSVNFKVRVLIKTHEVQIGKPSDKRPNIIRSACTCSRYPCSIVDYIDITVNNKSLIVPRSVFCDLADLNAAEISIEEKDSILMLTGGDASESYIVRIEFDAERIKRKVKASSMMPNEPAQETVYHESVMKDE